MGLIGGPVIVEANTESNVLSEIDDFRWLAAAARVSGASVSFASDDPLRRELARIVGLNVEASEKAVSGVRRAIESNAPTRKIDSVEVLPARPASTQPVPTLTEALNDYTNHGDESYASFSFVVNPPVPRRPGHRESEWYYDGTPLPTHSPSGRRRSSRRVGRAAGIATVAAIALLLASSAIMVALLAPQATVTLIPTTSVISADVSYGIAGQPGNVDVAIEPVSVQGEVTWSTTIPTTGVRSVPDGFAAGEILLTNPLTTEVLLPAGTVLSTPDGLSYSTTAEVVVPAADPFGSLTMGSAPAPIQASEAGPASNLPEQALSGQLDNGLFYSNRTPTAGGTMRDIAIVSEADIEALRSEAENALAAQHSETVTALVPQGQQLVQGSTTFGEVAATYSHEVGADAEEVSVSASQAISAAVFDPQELQRMASEELNRRLTASIPRENVLLADSITTSEPAELATASGNPEFRVSASAHTRAVLDPQVVAVLKRDLVGASEAEAAGKVALLKGVAGFNIEYGPDWFPLDWPPRLESRIAIDIDDSTATQKAARETRP